MDSRKDITSRVVLSAISGNGLITIAKFFCWLATPSPSMLAEAIHSFADTINQVLLFVGIRHSRWGPTKEYPWGLSNARYLWNLISAVGIFFAGFGFTTYHGIHSLIPWGGAETIEMNRMSIGVLLLAFVVEGYVFLVALKSIIRKKGNQPFFRYLMSEDNPTSLAVLLEDGIAVSGVVLAFLGIWLSNIFQTNIPDAITSIIIGCLLGAMAIGLAYINGRLLIGIAGSATEEKEIKKFVESQACVEKVTRLNTEVMGPARLRLSIEVEFHGGILIDRNQIIKDAEEIRSGREDPLPVLVVTAERMVRVIGKEINELEQKLYKRFPQLAVIDLEIN